MAVVCGKPDDVAGGEVRSAAGLPCSAGMAGMRPAVIL